MGCNAAEVLEAAKTFIRLGFDQRSANPSIVAFCHTTDIDMSPSASKLKKKAKARLTRNKPKPDTSEVSAHDGGAGQPSPSAQVDGGKVDTRHGESGSM